MVVSCDTDASFRWCSTPPSWHINAAGGRPPHHNIPDVPENCSAYQKRPFVQPPPFSLFPLLSSNEKTGTTYPPCARQFWKSGKQPLIFMPSRLRANQYSYPTHALICPATSLAAALRARPASRALMTVTGFRDSKRFFSTVCPRLILTAS